MIIVLGIVIVLLMCGGLYYWKYVRQAEGYKDTNDNSNPYPKFKLFFASWCGWSKKFSTGETGENAGEWEKLLENEIKGKVKLEKLVCDGDNKDECDKASIEGFPSMKFYKDIDSKGEDYNGDRTAEAIATWISNKID